MNYPESVKAYMIRRMTGPEQKSANALDHEVGIAQPALSMWLRKAEQNMKSKADGPEPKPSRATDGAGEEISKRRPQEVTPFERAKLVVMASASKGEDRNAFLREHGVHEAHLAVWEEAILSALDDRKGRRAGPSSGESWTARIRKLQRDVLLKDRALA